MVWLCIIFWGGIALAGPTAAQPHSQSMRQCAALCAAARTLVSQPDRQAGFDRAAAAFLDPAAGQVRAEGHKDPSAWVIGHRDAMRADWGARGRLAAVRQEVRDRTACCYPFAAERGIGLDLD